MKSMLVPTGYLLIVYSIVAIIRPSILELYIIIIGLWLSFTLLMTSYNYFRHGIAPLGVREVGWRLAKMLALLTAIVLISHYFSLWWGVLGYFLFVMVFAAYIIIKRRKYFMSGMRLVETQIWGKPLDKKEWEDETNENNESSARLQVMEDIDAEHVRELSDAPDCKDIAGQKSRNATRTNIKRSPGDPSWAVQESTSRGNGARNGEDQRMMVTMRKSCKNCKYNTPENKADNLMNGNSPCMMCTLFPGLENSWKAREE